MAWAALDYTGVRPALVIELRELEHRVTENERHRLRVRFADLIATMKIRALTIYEQDELCQIAAELRARAPGCR
jgi:hypothetical protein